MNNCNGSSVKLSGVDRKRGETTRQNIALFMRETGVRTGVLTVTFAEDLTTKEAQKKLHSFRTGVLSKVMGEMISVREFTQRGRPHFHIVVDCLDDITTGYNWAHHDAVTLWSKNGRKGRKPFGSLQRTDRLEELHRILNEKGPKYGLGRMELVPVKKPDAIGFYLGGYLAKSLANKPEDAKGTRAVNYSHKCPRSHKGTFSWANPSGWLWRAKVAKWCAVRGWFDPDDVPRCFGDNWMYRNREAILATPLTYWPTIEHAKRDNAFQSWDYKEMGPDAIEIQRLPLGSFDGASAVPGGVKPSIFLRFLPARAFLHLAFREVGSCVEVEEVSGSALWSMTSLHGVNADVKSGPCDSSQAPRGDRKIEPKATFPLEEGFEGKRGSHLQAAPLGESQKMDTRQIVEYSLDAVEESVERAGRILYGHNPF